MGVVFIAVNCQCGIKDQLDSSAVHNPPWGLRHLGCGL